jgi:hypothetical protein
MTRLFNSEYPEKDKNLTLKADKIHISDGRGDFEKAVEVCVYQNGKDIGSVVLNQDNITQLVEILKSDKKILS